MGSISADKVAQIKQAGAQANVAIDDDAAALLALHLDFVLEANSRARLTAIRSYEDGVRLHILDSLYAVPFINDALAGPVLDMGSGGGYPGIPIAVLADRPVTLVDSVGKKMRIIQEFIDSQQTLATVVSTASVRLEAPGDWVPSGGFSAVVARALSSLPALVELASPLLMKGGLLVSMKGDLSEEELARGNAAAGIVGLALSSTTSYELPGGGEKRSIVVYKKVGKPKIRLPRREGMAQRNPLA